MLYILECMFRGLAGAWGGVSSPMKTTGEKETWKDFLVGAIAWIIVIGITVVTVVLIKKKLAKIRKQRHLDQEKQGQTPQISPPAAK